MLCGEGRRATYNNNNNNHKNIILHYTRRAENNDISICIRRAVSNEHRVNPIHKLGLKPVPAAVAGTPGEGPRRALLPAARVPSPPSVSLYLYPFFFFFSFRYFYTPIYVFYFFFFPTGTRDCRPWVFSVAARGLHTVHTRACALLPLPDERIYVYTFPRGGVMRYGTAPGVCVCICACAARIII